MSDEIINLAFLKSFTAGNAEKMNKYINLFLQHAPVLVRAMEDNLAKEDWSSLRSSAHSLKPQISYMGIKSGEELIKTIELNAGEKINLLDLPFQIKTLKEILDQAYPELKKVTGAV